MAVDQPMSTGLPARGYSWEPFKPDNFAARKHGADSTRVVDPYAANVANALMRDHERLRNPLYREAVFEFARTVVRVDLMERHLIDGDLDDAGNPLPGSATLLRYRTHMLKVATELGLTPLSNARLGKDSASAQVDIARLLAGDVAKPTSIDSEAEVEVESKDGAV